MDYILDWATTISKQGIQKSQPPPPLNPDSFSLWMRSWFFFFSFFLTRRPKSVVTSGWGWSLLPQPDMEKLSKKIGKKRRRF